MEISDFMIGDIVDVRNGNKNPLIKEIVGVDTTSDEVLVMFDSSMGVFAIHPNKVRPVQIEERFLMKYLLCHWSYECGDTVFTIRTSDDSDADVVMLYHHSHEWHLSIGMKLRDVVIRYVHEFQNIVRVICGYELQFIKLN